MANSTKTAAPLIDLSRSSYVVQKRSSGVSVVRPSGVPAVAWAKGVVVAWILLTAFKALVLASVGASGYEDRVGTVMQGTWAESLGAALLSADRVTVYIAKGLFPIF